MPIKDLVTIPFTKALSPEEEKYLIEIMNGLDRQITLTSEWLASDEAAELAGASQVEINAYFRNSGIRDQFDNLISYNASNSQEFINEYYHIGAELGFKDISRMLAYTPADREALFRLTSYNFDLISNLNNDMRGEIREIIFNAVAAGDGYNSTMQRLLELPLEPIGNISARTRAEMIARTEHARAVNTGTLQAYSDYGVGQVEISTTGDSLVCDICMDLEDKNPYSLSEAQSLLPAHPNCRCAYIPVLDSISDTVVSNPVVIDLIN